VAKVELATSRYQAKVQNIGRDVGNAARERHGQQSVGAN
jgi:hypothetical protein